jgi:hypothetical protein
MPTIRDPKRTLETVMRRLAWAVAATAAVLALAPPDASAQARKQPPTPTVSPDGAHAASPYYRRAPDGRGFAQRRGGYSYGLGDITNTYGDGRVRFGANNAYRDTFADRQTRSGPFDHGFFFDSGIAPRGGDSPYRN